MNGLLFALISLLLAFTWLHCRRSFKAVRPTFNREIAEQINESNLKTLTSWVIGGMMGSGKTTLGSFLSKELEIYHLEIDRFDSKEAVTHYLLSKDVKEHVAEANPWQIPDSLYEEADVIVFLDYRSTVNYIRLLLRGFRHWKRSRYSLHAFKHYIVYKVFVDLGPIVFRYGAENRAGWRKDGIAGPNVDISQAVYVRSISPAETKVLCEHIEKLASLAFSRMIT